MKFFIWTIGCQMNKAESTDIEKHLMFSGCQPADDIGDADIVVLNTCVVRQHAEDKVTSMLGFLKRKKSKRPDMRIAVTGCFVSSDTRILAKRFPLVDIFVKAGDFIGFADWFDRIIDNAGNQELKTYPPVPVSVYVPIIQGCNNFCSYCIVPYRRGRERSRLPDEILAHVSRSVEEGVREVVLLGQNVNAYGMDLEIKTDLAGLLETLSKVEGLYRIRFLTNHPKDMKARLIKAIASLDRVCRHVNLPLQSGDDRILAAMNRNYTSGQYISLINEMRDSIPGIALSTDVIVGFPGESEEQFLNTYKVLEDIRFDAVHAAAYSIRSGTKASKDLADDVLYEVKMQRLYRIEELQREIAGNINSRLMGTDLEVLVEGNRRGKWYGRSYSDKLVFFNYKCDMTGKLVNVKINTSSPWALQGEVRP